MNSTSSLSLEAKKKNPHSPSVHYPWLELLNEASWGVAMMVVQELEEETVGMIRQTTRYRGPAKGASFTRYQNVKPSHFWIRWTQVEDIDVATGRRPRY